MPTAAKYRANAEHYREYERARRERNLEAERERDRVRGYRGDPEKNRARMAARVIPRQACEHEGCKEIGERHHDDYSRPLAVRFLCSRHHAEEHRKHSIKEM